jgi:hypothetical protein
VKVVPDSLKDLSAAFSQPFLEAPVTTTAVIVLGILTWVVMAIPLALVVAQVNRLTRPQAPAVELSLTPAVGKPVLDTAVEANPVLNPVVEGIAWLPAEPTRFVGRAEVMAATSAAVAPASGRTAVVFHGITGVGKTTCAIELAYRHQHGFTALAFWSAPSDPDQFGDALRLLAVALEAQLADHGFAMLDEIATVERLQNLLPTLSTVLADAGVLLILDNLDTLLTPEGQWRDPRWAPLISALTDHHGPSRVILTSRIVPTGLNPNTVLIQPVPALSQKESLWLIRRLPHLRALLHTMPLGRGVLTLAQGHPQLLELADAAAVDPPRLAYQLAEIDAAVDPTTPLAAFFTEGATRLDVKQLQQILTAWITTVAATLPAPSRLLLHALCRIEETDRNTAIIAVNWPVLWRRVEHSGEPPSFASTLAPLTTAALIATHPINDPTDPHEPVRYRIHPGIIAAIHTMTPQPVAAAVDAQLAAWWTIVGGGEIDQHHTSNDITQFTARAGLTAAHYLLHQHGWNSAQLMVRANLAAATYLLRQHDYDTASCLLERALNRQGYSPLPSLAVLPLLRRIAEATGAAKDLTVLGAALRKVDPGEAETMLRRAYDQASTDGDHGLASTTAGELVTLLRDQGRLGEALTQAGQKIEHTHRAGFGLWTLLSDHGRRLQILHLLGHHQQVLNDLPTLRTQMAQLPDHPASNDRVNPENARQGILDIGRLSAMALQRWHDALDLNQDIVNTQRRFGANPEQIARTRFHDYLPLRHLARLTEADHLLRDCQNAFDPTGDITQLAVIYAARADLAHTRNHPADAIEFQRTSLRLCYLHPDPHHISTAHHHLANYLSRAAADPAEQRAHRLTTALLHHLTGNTPELTTTLNTLINELRTHTSDPNAPKLPATLPEITHLIDTDDQIHLGDLLTALCPNPTTAEHALTNLITTATNSANQAH